MILVIAFPLKLIVIGTADAWHIVNTTDPLIDSDDELGDEYVRQDYSAPPSYASLRAL